MKNIIMFAQKYGFICKKKSFLSGKYLTQHIHKICNYTLLYYILNNNNNNSTL